MVNEITPSQIRAVPAGYKNLAPDCHGDNFFDLDHALQGLVQIYLPADLRAHMVPHYRELGELAGNRLDELARICDRHKPVLHARDALGRDQDWIEFHPAYREMEAIGFGKFGMACMSHKPGVLGWPQRIPATAKYIFQYLFAQAEFGLLCPISVSDTSAMLMQRYADADTRALLLEPMLSEDMARIYKSAQFMTEKVGGSDVSGLELQAREENGQWRLHGEKWFCSCADADVALLLARPEGAPAGNSGLALFAMPRTLPDGQRNTYRIVRLKNKMGTLSMASGEIVFDGALAYPLGTTGSVGAHPNDGLRMMMDQVNLSRLSHGVRAAGMMRRCLNEALRVANTRVAFGETLMHKPLMRRQLMKLMLPTEQALSMILFAARQMQAEQGGDTQAGVLLRLLTPVIKVRACRDNIRVATGAMEVRGGNGYIEDWIQSRMVRDAHVGVLWEGTSNINALDVTKRAIGRGRADQIMKQALIRMLEQAPAVPGNLRASLMDCLERAFSFVETVALTGNEPQARMATNAVYHICSAVLMSCEGQELGRNGGDARRLLLARLVIDHRLQARDPLAIEGSEFDECASTLLLSDEPVSLQAASAALASA